MKGLLYINWLGIDVALGSAALAYALAYAWNVSLPFYSLLLLACVVWLIYTADHLRDVYLHHQCISSERRTFHLKHSRRLLWAGIIILLAVCGLLLTQPLPVFLYGLVLLLLVFFYFLALQFMPRIFMPFKEFAAAFFYTLGICLLPMVYALSENIMPIQGVQVFFLALSNLVIFSWFDRADDAREGFNGLVSVIGFRSARKLIVVLLLFQVILASLSIYFGSAPSLGLCFLCMILLLTMLVGAPAYWSQRQRFRVIGDAIFFIPLLTLWL